MISPHFVPLVTPKRPFYDYSRRHVLWLFWVPGSSQEGPFVVIFGHHISIKRPFYYRYFGPLAPSKGPFYGYLWAMFLPRRPFMGIWAPGSLFISGHLFLPSGPFIVILVPMFLPRGPFTVILSLWFHPGGLLELFWVPYTRLGSD